MTERDDIRSVFLLLDEPPAPEFEASLRRRLLDELTTNQATPLQEEAVMTLDVLERPDTRDGDTRRHAPRRRRWLAAGAAAIAAAAAIAVVVADDGADDLDTVPPVGADSERGAPTVIDEVPASDAGWVASNDGVLVVAGGRIVSVLDETGANIVGSGAITGTPILAEPAVGLGSAWVLDGELVVHRIDVGTFEEEAAIELAYDGPVSGGRGGQIGGIAVEDGAVWVALFDAEQVARIDPDTNEVVATVDTPGFRPMAVAVGEGGVWVAADADVGGAALRIDPAADEVVATIELAGERNGNPVGNVVDIAVGAGSVWAANSDADLIHRIDPDTNTEETRIAIRSDGATESVVADDDSVWTLSRTGGRVDRIDPDTNRVDGSVDVAFPVHLALTDAGTVWAVSYTEADTSRNSVVHIRG